MRGSGAVLHRRARPLLRAGELEHRRPTPATLYAPEPRAGMASGSSVGSAHALAEGPRRILLVDDQRDILDSLKLFLESALPDVEVLVAASAREALQVLEGPRVDLVITDLRMPDINGLELLRKVRASHRDVPVFLMTAYVQSELAEEARDSPEFQEFIAKPIDGARLVALARGYLGS